MGEVRTVLTPELVIGYEDSGPKDGTPVVLLHGWPDDIRTWDGVVNRLSADGYRTLAPYLRGFGPTHFRKESAMRSGQQAALGKDVLSFLDALRIPHAILVGYDWGGRAACVAAALWPERAIALVAVGGYTIQQLAKSSTPALIPQEQAYWYQWYFQTARGRAGLTQHRRELAGFLWTLWSPNWRFDDETFEATAVSFDNPDFVDVTIHSYRHRYGCVPGDALYDELELALAEAPSINIPSCVLHGEADAVDFVANSEHHGQHFTSHYERKTIPKAGHFLPRENPDAIAEAVRRLSPH